MLESVRTSLIERLAEAGLAVSRPYTEEPCIESGSRVTLAVRRAELRDAGFARYMGTVEGEGGVLREVRGVRCRLELALDVYAVSAAGCETAADLLLTALGGIEDMGLESFHSAEPVYDKDTGLFLSACGAGVQALLTFEANEDEETEFADFILKGEIRK